MAGTLQIPVQANVHHRVWEQEEKPWRPIATYALLGAMVGVYLLQLGTIRDVPLHNRLFTIDNDWLLRPWSLVTSTFAHDPYSFGHILINGLMLFFFGPQLERILGRRDYVSLFLVAGAITGILQVELSQAWGVGLPALGASGALFFVFTTVVVLFPNNTILLYGIIPLKLWVAGVLFAIIDIIGAFNPFDAVGNFAHLAGATVGLGLGFGLRKNPRLPFGRRRRNFATM